MNSRILQLQRLGGQVSHHGVRITHYLRLPSWFPAAAWVSHRFKMTVLYGEEGSHCPYVTCTTYNWHRGKTLLGILRGATTLTSFGLRVKRVQQHLESVLVRNVTPGR